MCHNLLQFDVSMMPTSVLSNYLTKDHTGAIVVQALQSGSTNTVCGAYPVLRIYSETVDSQISPVITTTLPFKVVKSFFSGFHEFDMFKYDEFQNVAYEKVENLYRMSSYQ